MNIQRLGTYSLLAVWLLALALSAPAAAGTQIPPDFAPLLTEQEKAYLSKTEVIRVHNETDWAPFNFNWQGEPKGFSIDYMKLLSKTTGLEVEFVNGPTWDQFLEMTKAGKLDVMLNIAKSVERQEYLEFTPPYVTMIQMLYTRNDYPPVNSIKDLYGKRFAVPKGFFLHQVLKEHPEIQIVEVENTTQAILAVSVGKADALFDLMPVVDYITKQMQITNLKVGGSIGLEEGKPIPLHIAVRKDLKVLADILEKGMKWISDDELEKLNAKWMTRSSNVMQVSKASSASLHELTAEERSFLGGKELRLGVDSARPPFEFIDEKGNYLGISAEFMEALAQRLGATVVPVKDVKWADALEKIKTGEIDIIPKITPTPERAKHMLFTRPYITFPSVIITRKDRFVSGMDDLTGLKVAVVKGLIIEGFLKRDRPELTLVPYPDIETALRELSAGKADAFIDNLGTVTYTIDKIGLTNLKVAASTPYTHDLAMGVRRDWPLVVIALDKALASISDKERADIKNHWLSIQLPGIDWKKVGPIGAALIAVTIFVLIWNRRLGKAIKERERAEQILLQQAEELQAQQERLKETEAWFRGIIESAPDGILVSDDQGTIILANTMVDKMFGYDSGELLGKNVDLLVPVTIRPSHEDKRTQFLNTATVREMGTGLDLKGVRKNGSEYPVEIGLSRLPALGARGPCVCASIRDITERKRVEEELKQYVKELQRFNRLVTGREIRMVQLKQEINELRAGLGQSAKYLVGMDLSQETLSGIMDRERDAPSFQWGMVGNITEGRPSLGSSMDVGVYRLMQFSIRDVITTRFDARTAQEIYCEAGKLAGRELYRAMIVKGKRMHEFVSEVQDLLANLNIGLLKLEKSDWANGNFVVTVEEDLDCSGLPVSNETICTYSEGFFAGLLEEHTGLPFDVKEVNCWCTGDRICRFDISPSKQ